MDFIKKSLINLIPEYVRNVPCYMDFDGQRRAEKTFQIIILLFAIVGFVWGYLCQQFSQTIYILGAGFILSCLLTLPPWPMYRHKPLKWQPPRNYEDEEEDGASSKVSSISTSTKAKKKK